MRQTRTQNETEEETLLFADMRPPSKGIDERATNRGANAK